MQELVLKDLEIHTSIHVAGTFMVTGNKAMEIEEPTVRDQRSTNDWELYTKTRARKVEAQEMGSGNQES